MKRRWTAVVLAALGAGCVGGRGRGVGSGEDAPPPVAVQTGVFRQLGLLTPKWVLDPEDPAAPDVALRVTSHTRVYEDGAFVGLDEVDAGERVRVVYTPQREGPGLVERIDVLQGPSTERGPSH